MTKNPKGAVPTGNVKPIFKKRKKEKPVKDDPRSNPRRFTTSGFERIKRPGSKEFVHVSDTVEKFSEKQPREPKGTDKRDSTGDRAGGQWTSEDGNGAGAAVKEKPSRAKTTVDEETFNFKRTSDYYEEQYALSDEERVAAVDSYRENLRNRAYTTISELPPDLADAVLATLEEEDERGMALAADANEYQRNAYREQGIAVDHRNGEVSWHSRPEYTTSTSISIPDDEEVYIVGKVFSHGHPGDRSFTSKDVDFCISRTVREGRVVTHAAVYRLTPGPSASWRSGMSWKDHARRTNHIYLEELALLRRAAELELGDLPSGLQSRAWREQPDEVKSVAQHMLWDRVASRMGWRYVREPHSD